MVNVKVFPDKQTDERTNGQTDGQAKSYMPPIYRCQGIKNLENNTNNVLTNG